MIWRNSKVQCASWRLKNYVDWAEFYQPKCPRSRKGLEENIFSDSLSLKMLHEQSLIAAQKVWPPWHALSLLKFQAELRTLHMHDELAMPRCSRYAGKPALRDGIISLVDFPLSPSAPTAFRLSFWHWAVTPGEAVAHHSPGACGIDEPLSSSPQ